MVKRGQSVIRDKQQIGDIIGCYLDLNKREVSFSRNGHDLGVAFTGIPVGEVYNS